MSGKDKELGSNDKPKWGKRTLWFIALWVGGVLTITAISYSLRTLLSIPY